MCDPTGKEITYTAGTPKDVAPLRRQLIGTLSDEMNKGATPYNGQLSPGTNQLSLQAANVLSNIMDNIPYTNAGSGRGGSGGGWGGGSGGGLTPTQGGTRSGTVPYNPRTVVRGTPYGPTQGGNSDYTLPPTGSGYQGRFRTIGDLLPYLLGGNGRA